MKICAVGVRGSHQGIRTWGLLRDLVTLRSVTNGLGVNGLESLGCESLGRESLGCLDVIVVHAHVSDECLEGECIGPWDVNVLLGCECHGYEWIGRK